MRVEPPRRADLGVTFGRIATLDRNQHRLARLNAQAPQRQCRLDQHTPKTFTAPSIALTYGSLLPHPHRRHRPKLERQVRIRRGECVDDQRGGLAAKDVILGAYYLYVRCPPPEPHGSGLRCLGHQPIMDKNPYTVLLAGHTQSRGCASGKGMRLRRVRARRGGPTSPDKQYAFPVLYRDLKNMALSGAHRSR